jgi:hypothetical protein
MRTMKLAIALLAVAASGCNHNTTTPCQDSISGVLERSVDTSGSDVDTVREYETRLGNALAKLCTEDRWSAPMLQCLDAANDAASARACMEKLSQPQLARLTKIMSELTGMPLTVTPAARKTGSS